MSKETKKEEKKIDYGAAYDAAEKKRIELEAKLKCKVKMAFLVNPSEGSEPCVCYFRVATTATKMKCRDLAVTSPSKADSVLFEATIIREESDKRVFKQDDDEDDFYFAALEWCSTQNGKAAAMVKKK